MPVTTNVEEFLEGHPEWIVKATDSNTFTPIDVNIIGEYIKRAGIKKFLIKEDHNELVKYQVKSRRALSLKEYPTEDDVILYSIEQYKVMDPITYETKYEWNVRYGVDTRCL